MKKAVENAKTKGDDTSVRSKEKKLERASMHRAIDGKKFKLFSLSKISEDALRQPDHVELKKPEKVSHFKFPNPDIASLRLASPESPIFAMENCSLQWNGSSRSLLEHVTFEITIKTRLGVVGPNGQGKSTLMSCLMPSSSFGSSTTAEHVFSSVSNKSNVEEISYRGDLIIRGRCWSHHNLRVAILAQHHIDVLETFLHESPYSYIEKSVVALKKASRGSSSSSSSNGGDEASATSETALRSHLGGFGLSGNIVFQPIGSLSGGQKARLALSVACLNTPHLLLLDEPSNNLSLEATRELIQACQDFPGAVVVVSHHRDFLVQVCQQLLVVDQGIAYVKSSARMKAPVFDDNTEDSIPKGKKTAKAKAKEVAKIMAAGTAALSSAKIGEDTFEEILDSYVAEQVAV